MAIRRRFFVEQELAVIRQLYADTPTRSIARQLGRSLSSVYQAAQKLSLCKSAAYLASPAACRLRREASPASIACRFVKGQIPVNKGVKHPPGWSPGRMADTQFKPGVRAGIAADNWCPIGTIRADGEGFLRIKVREGVKGEAYGFGNTKIWPLLNRYTWEAHRGPIPPSHAVIFVDGDRANCAIENLDCISRRELMRRNSVHRLPKELADIIQLSGALKRQLRKHEKQNDRPAQPSL